MSDSSMLLPRATISVVVHVEYGSCAHPALDRLLAETNCRLERVSTDVTPGQVLNCPNEAFEFSGYQEGLARVLRAHSAKPTQHLNLVFANDSLAHGHPVSLSYRMLRWLIQLQPASKSRFVGLRMPINDGIRALAGEHGYVSTWAFALNGTVAALRAVRFYDDNEVFARFASTVHRDLPPAYLAWQRSWLAPTGWFSGWYKACPGVALKDTTLHRKELAIYLEHRLPQRLASLGFEMVDLGTLLSPVQALCLRGLRLLDRIYVNRLKLAYRLPLLLRRTLVQR